MINVVPVIDAEGWATIDVVDDSGLWNPGAFEQLEARVARALDDGPVRGVVLRAGRVKGPSTLDFDWLYAATEPNRGNGSRDALARTIERMHALLARIERAEVPVIAVMRGFVAGPELEVCLACHARVAASGATLAFDLARWGLPPMLGAAQRLARRCGTATAEALLLDERPRRAADAKALGLVDDVVDADALEQRARGIVASRAQAAPAPAAMPKAPEPFDETRRPAAPAIRASLVDAATLPLEEALRNDADRFIAAAFDRVARAMIRTRHLSVARANRLASRPAGFPTQRFRRVGVLGAGLMGSGIACVCARAGMHVVLVDRTRDAAERGKAAVLRQSDPTAAARVSATDRYEDLADVDIVVEAVFEDRAVKASATQRAEASMPAAALFATNTSTLPISSLAQASARPDQFIGLHFFSPVPRMPLLEVIRGNPTSDATLAAALDFARAIGKTPIVVNDRRGFYTTRVIMTYQAEAFEMLAEGIEPELIERAGLASGMPLPPLLLSDAVAIDLIHQINEQARRDDSADESTLSPRTAAQRVVATMVEDLGRPGKKSGRGFYDYSDDGSKRLWPELARQFAPARSRSATLEELRDRLLDIQALEAVRCLDERVIVDPSEGDVGALLGWNFAPWTGGPLSYIDMTGPVAFVSRCDKWRMQFGPRFEAPASLRALAAEGGTVYAHRWG